MQPKCWTGRWACSRQVFFTSCSQICPPCSAVFFFHCAAPRLWGVQGAVLEGTVSRCLCLCHTPQGQHDKQVLASNTVDDGRLHLMIIYPLYVCVRVCLSVSFPCKVDSFFMGLSSTPYPKSCRKGRQPLSHLPPSSVSRNRPPPSSPTMLKHGSPTMLKHGSPIVLKKVSGQPFSHSHICTCIGMGMLFLWYSGYPIIRTDKKKMKLSSYLVQVLFCSFAENWEPQQLNITM